MDVRPDDLEVLTRAHDWLSAGHRVALCTLTNTWGSAPRPPGSLLALNDAGHYVGSLSGGCVEEILAERYRTGELSGGPTWVEFGVDRGEAQRIGLPCGGQLKLLIEQLQDPASIAALLRRLQGGELVARRVELASGRVSLLPGEAGAELELTGSELVRRFGPEWHLLLIGDGQLARHLAAMALQLDYRVTICDPRGGFEAATPVAGVDYSRAMPDDAVHSLGNQPRSAIVTLAHDPRQDDLGLSAALESRAFYIGALGSSRTARARRERLRSLGYSERQLQRIHGPAGLPIGSRRPAEIALSILAQITAIRNGVMPAASTDPEP